jgi:hypothetical protein
MQVLPAAQAKIGWASSECETLKARSPGIADQRPGTKYRGQECRTNVRTRRCSHDADVKDRME